VCADGLKAAAGMDASNDILTMLPASIFKNPTTATA